MRSSRAHSTTARTARTPIRCPSTRGSPRSFAHRPLPSMMMATCRGKEGVSRPKLVIGMGAEAEAARSDLQDLLFLRLEDLVDLLHVGVRLLLDPFLPALHDVLGDLLLLLPVLELLDRLPADVAHRD